MRRQCTDTWVLARVFACFALVRLLICLARLARVSQHASHVSRGSRASPVLSSARVDFALHLASGAGTPFLSKFCLVPTRRLNEMLLALAVVDLALTPASPPDVSVVDGNLCFAATSPLVVFYKDMACVDEPRQTTVLVGQNYFDPADRYVRVKGVQLEKYISDFEFLNQKVRRRCHPVNAVTDRKAAL